jgi:hypothetical protein
LPATPPCVSFDDPETVASLLQDPREEGAADYARTLAERLPAEGLFGLFREQADHQGAYPFGREPDGSATPEWGWSDFG